MESRGKRPLPTGLGMPSAHPDDVLVEQREVPWLEPVPDAMVGADEADPAAIVANRASVRLALVAALQHLPPRQRAVLVLRDVLKWRAAEVAVVLDVSTTAVNSMLQRARAQLQQAGLTEDSVVEPSDPAQRALLDRYARALEDKDVATIVRLFTEDARWEMPPFVGWYHGPDAIARLIDRQCPAGPGQLRMLPTRANGQPAFGMYMLGEDGAFHPFQLHVVDLADGGIRHVAAFFDVTLFPLFGLPETVAADAEPRPVSAGRG